MKASCSQLGGMPDLPLVHGIIRCRGMAFTRRYSWWLMVHTFTVHSTGMKASHGRRQPQRHVN